MDNSLNGSDRPASGLTIPWSWLTLALAVVATGAIGTLVVVVSTSNADTLSTVALALAVIAFAAQLIVSLVQGMTGAQQIAQVERINADTQSALSALRAASDSLLATQKEHFGQVLRAALSRAVPDAVQESLADTGGPGQDVGNVLDPVALQESILARVEDRLREEQTRSSLSRMRSRLTERDLMRLSQSELEDLRAAYQSSIKGLVHPLVASWTIDQLVSGGILREYERTMGGQALVAVTPYGMSILRRLFREADREKNPQDQPTKSGDGDS